MSIKLIFLGCLVSISTSLWAIDDGEFRGETKAKIEILQKQNDEIKTKIVTLEKDSQSVEEFKNSITDQDKRIQDLSFYTSLIATLIAILTLIVGAVGVAFPYLMFRQNSKSQEEAKKDIELWKIKTKSEFDAELENFKKIKEEKSLEIKNHTEEAKRKIDGKVQEISNISVEELKQSGIQISIEDEKEIRKESQIIADEAEKENDVDGFITSAKLSFSIQNYGDALRNIEKALGVTKNDTETAQLLFLKGIVLDKLNKIEDEIMIYDELVKRFNTNREDIIQIQLANALFNKGIKLTDMNRDKEAINAYTEVINRFIESKNAILQERVADSLINKGIRFGIMNRNDEAINVFDILLSHFDNDSTESILSKIAICLLNKGYALGNLNRYNEAILLYDELFNRFENSTNELIQEQVSTALYNKAVLLSKVDDDANAIKSYDEVIKKFQTTTNEKIKETISKTFINMGLTYSKINQHNNAISAYDNFIQTFKNTSNNKIKNDIFRAYNSKGYTLEQMGHPEEAISVFEEALKEIVLLDNRLFDEQIAKLLLNKGYSLGKVGKFEEEISTYNTLISLFQAEHNDVIVEAIISAQLNKAVRLNEIGENETALNLLHHITNEYQNSNNQKLISDTYLHIGLLYGRKKYFKESIQAYEKSIQLTPNNHNAYINLLEIQLIFLQKFETNTVHKLLEICKDDNQTLLKYYMLKSVHDALLHEQSEQIAELKKEFQGIDFGEWGWAELDDWANNLKDTNAKERVLATIEQFKNW